LIQRTEAVIPLQHRSIRFDGHAVTVSHDQEEMPALLDFLFRDIHTRDTGSAADPVRFQVTHNGEENSWVLRRNDTVLYRGADIDGLGNVLMGEVLFHLIEHNSNGMAIHAGLVSGQDGAWLLPADSGSGKTSVTTWLLTRGYHYHTDELVILDPNSESVTPFTRPLNVKTSGLAAINALVDLNAISGDIRSSAMVTMIPHRLVNPDYRPEVPPLSAIIFPHYSSDSEPGLQQLSGAEAGLELMRSNVIARNLPGHGFADVVRLVRRLPAYRLHYGHFDDLEELFGSVG
jgi:hypothetical protein